MTTLFTNKSKHIHFEENRNCNIKGLSSFSIMMEYDIDNTLNAIKESGCHLIESDKECLSFVKSVTTNSQTQVLPSKESSGELQTLSSITQSDIPVQENTARKRWHLLAKVVRKTSKKITSHGDFSDEHLSSIRRFKSFNLLRQDSFQDHASLKSFGNSENWYKYRILLEVGKAQEFHLNIHHTKRSITTADLVGFNNTGNICIWPSEEALTVHVLSDLQAYYKKWILELGGGFTCLSGLMLAKYAKPYAVHLTDGNEISVENLKRSICLNELSCYTKCSVLKWEDVKARSSSEASKFDIILSADCVFFDESRLALIDTIWYYLSNTGTALIMAPKRGKTMTHFIEESIARGFLVTIVEMYNESIWKRHLKLKECLLYNEDLHYPVLLYLKKH